jgi:DNA-directed RNA polymerase specialized sigma subunit
MANRPRTQEQDDGERSDWQMRQALQNSSGTRALRSKLTKLEKTVITLIYSEGMTVRETASILRLGAGGVKTILWRVTERFCNDEELF